MKGASQIRYCVQTPGEKTKKMIHPYAIESQMPRPSTFRRRQASVRTARIIKSLQPVTTQVCHGPRPKKLTRLNSGRPVSQSK